MKPLLLSLLLSASLSAQSLKTAVVSPEGEPRLLHALLSVNYVLQASDLSVTEYSIGANKARELNPFLRGFAADPVKMATIKMSGAVLTDYVLHRLHDQHPRAAVVLAAIVDTTYVFVIRHNVQVIR